MFSPVIAPVSVGALTDPATARAVAGPVERGKVDGESSFASIFGREGTARRPSPEDAADDGGTAPADDRETGTVPVGDATGDDFADSDGAGNDAEVDYATFDHAADGKPAANPAIPQAPQADPEADPARAGATQDGREARAGSESDSEAAVMQDAIRFAYQAEAQMTSAPPAQDKDPRILTSQQSVPEAAPTPNLAGAQPLAADSGGSGPARGVFTVGENVARQSLKPTAIERAGQEPVMRPGTCQRL